MTRYDNNPPMINQQVLNTAQLTPVRCQEACDYDPWPLAVFFLKGLYSMSSRRFG